ncbi:MAG TPA: hypothetical protein DD417_06395 [Elusimicrobia bacterium]|nr:hypothetical protein [Elusimicrobiota bacterium]
MSSRPGSSTLSNGVTIPRIGLGVFRMAPGAETRRSVAAALELGYRHVDTATLYRNEADVGAAVAGSGLPRGSVFVTTKLWNQDQGCDAALRACERSRRALGLDVIDLYLLHWPVPGLRLESWRALEALYERGEVRAIGVSNFMVHHLEELISRARVAPMVNQIEVHPFLQHRETRAWCAAHGVVVEAYSPLAKAEVLGHESVVRIARASGVTPAQLLLAWGLQKDLVVLPKSVDPERQAENLAAAAVRLSPQAMSELDALEQGLATGWDPRSAP